MKGTVFKKQKDMAWAAGRFLYSRFGFYQSIS
jgi:hypothetical protein